MVRLLGGLGIKAQELRKLDSPGSPLRPGLPRRPGGPRQKNKDGFIEKESQRMCTWPLASSSPTPAELAELTHPHLQSAPPG